MIKLKYLQTLKNIINVKMSKLSTNLQDFINKWNIIIDKEESSNLSTNNVYINIDEIESQLDETS